jgi:thymidylate synthase (FAD)
MTTEITRIDCLDHGYVILVDCMGDDKAIVEGARVSYDDLDLAGVDEEKDKKLIRYLYKNKHSSPFEQVEFKFQVQAPIFVFRQWHRHRTWSLNEMSARYTILPELFYVPEIMDIGEQSARSKQARDLKENERAEHIRSQIRTSCGEAFSEYRQLLGWGCPRELARSVLPVATYSKMVAKVDLHNLFHFLKLRLHPHAQYEIRVYAEAMLRMITPVVPVAAEVFTEYEYLSTE